ncbi:MAG: ISTde1, transposase [Rhodocyclaceae bacterium]|nr:MAG: ISTde1, transposase [Rhodocyclaceae bacterium]
MSRKERARLTIMTGVTDGKLTVVQAAELMGVCYRQGRRIWKRYQADGDAGLVHRLRGQPSARRKPAALRAQALALYAQERHADFGPTLMAEQLAKQKLVVDHETLRRWRMAAGQHTVGRRKQAHRQWRERKPSFGAMVQMDGSHHAWFAGPQVRADGDGGRRDQPDAGTLLRGGDDARQLRRAGRLGEKAWAARQPVCGPGQHLPV